MPNFPRTDLAVEAEAIHRSAAAVTELPGVRAEETNRRGFSVTEVHVLDAAGENALCKPIGDYYTLALDPLLRREDDAFENAAQTLAELLRGVLPLMPDASVLVVGLGNRAITPDAVGPDAIDSVMVTRHLREQLPEHFGQFRPVAALAAGVLGTTGVESADMIRALAAHLRFRQKEGRYITLLGRYRPRVIYLPYDNVIFNRYQGQKFITSATLLLLF